MMRTAVRVDDIPAVRKAEAMRLAAAEYDRFLALLRQLQPDDWSKPTVNTGWDVRAVVLHVLGAAEGNASMREAASQMRRGSRLAKERGMDHFVHGVNEVQIADRSELSPAEIIDRFSAVIPKAVKGRRRLPPFMRPVRVRFPEPLGKRSLAYLMDLVYTRDTWMHRIDICRAAGIEPVITAEHDGRLMADMVSDWAKTNGHAFHIELTGPAGGTYMQGTDGEQLTIDAVVWIWIVSGRGEGTGLLTKELPL